jgi:membrane protein YdbS with pleckstrin-like domain
MARIPGDPGPLRWLRFAAGFRLPEENRDWVRHELTDAGWRWRTVLRHLAVIIPVCAVVAVLLLTLSPAPAWFAVLMVVLILCGSIFTVAAYADDIRASRLRQHGLDVPDDPDLGHPSH